MIRKDLGKPYWQSYSNLKGPGSSEKRLCIEGIHSSDYNNYLEKKDTIKEMNKNLLALWKTSSAKSEDDKNYIMNSFCNEPVDLSGTDILVRGLKIIYKKPTNNPLWL